jgi:hypothetical protein
MGKTLSSFFAFVLLVLPPSMAAAAEPSARQGTIINNITAIGGKYTLDEKAPEKPIVAVSLQLPFPDPPPAVRGRAPGFSPRRGNAPKPAGASDPQADAERMDALLAQLKLLPALRELHLNDAFPAGSRPPATEGFTDECTKYIQDMVQMEILDLSNTHVTDVGLARLQGLSFLRSLNLTKTSDVKDAFITDAGMKYIAVMPQLEELWLRGNQHIGDAGIVSLTALPKLRSLGLGSTLLTDAGLMTLGSMTQLEDLGLSNTRITDTGLSALKNLPQLRALGLSGTQITDNGLKSLEGCAELRVLILQNTSITNGGLVSLEKLPNLEELNLDETRVNDWAQYSLKNMPRLKSLSIVNSGFTKEGAKYMRTLLPQTEVKY